MITGPIIPTQYQNPNAASPNPTIAATGPAEMANYGCIITCSKTGRMWMGGRNAQGNFVWNPVLPYTRNDSGTTGVQVTNSSGNMVFSQPSGASSGTVDILGQAQFDGTQIILPAFTDVQSTDGPLITLPNGRLETANPMQSSVSADASIGTSLTNISELQLTPSITGTYRVTVVGLLYHANQFRVTVGLRFWNTAQDNYFLNATTVESQQGGWHPFALAGEVSITSETQSIRVAAISTVAGVLMKTQPADSLPFPGLPVSPTRATRMLIERIKGAV